MAVFHCVEQMEENVLDETIVPQIAAAMQVLCGEIVVRCIVHDNAHVCILLNHAAEGDDARVGRGDLKQSDLDLPLAERPMPEGNKPLHCVGPLVCMAAEVNRTINDAEASNTPNFDEFEGSSIHEIAELLFGGTRAPSGWDGDALNTISGAVVEHNRAKHTTPRWSSWMVVL